MGKNLAWPHRTPYFGLAYLFTLYWTRKVSPKVVRCVSDYSGYDFSKTRPFGPSLPVFARVLHALHTRNNTEFKTFG